MQAQAKTKFKKTPIGEIPEDWEVVRLKDVLLILRNGLTARQNKEGVGYPITRIETIAMERIDPSKVGFVENVSPKDLEKYRLYPGDILFSHINSLTHIGKTAIYEGKPNPLLHGMNLLLLRPDSKKIKPWYLLWLLKLYRERGIFKNIAKKAVNQASINQTELGKLKIPLPPLPEQKKITEILRTVDEAIEKTDGAIERTERLKKGLMQRLLTRGIKHERFKKTELGEIPEEWRVVRLGEIAQKIKTGPFGSQLRKSELTDRGIKVYTQDNVLRRDFSLGNIYISPEKFKQLKSMEVKPGDILLTIRGTVGKAIVVPEGVEKGIIHTNLAIIRVNPEILWPEYLERIINDSKIIPWQINAARSSTTLPALYAGTIKRLKLPLPPLSEQKQIAEILSTVDRKLELLRQRREKLERVKRGLMKDLLTGRKRVLVTTEKHK